MHSGFRKGRSTTDQLVHLESVAREAFVQKQRVTAIFFELEKVYMIQNISMASWKTYMMLVYEGDFLSS